MTAEPKGRHHHACIVSDLAPPCSPPLSAMFGSIRFKFRVYPWWDVVSLGADP